MSTASTAEVELLDATSRTLRERGYNIVLQPADSLLPEMLKGLRPDAIAIGRSPKLVIEVAAEGGSSADRVARIQRALRDETDWKLHLILDRASGSSLPIASIQEIRSAITSAENLAGREPKAGLIVCWACLEALGRLVEPGDFSRAQSPTRIVELLAGNARITPNDAAFLRAMAQMRNAFVHGDFSQRVTEEEVRRFTALLLRFLDQIAAAWHRGA